MMVTTVRTTTTCAVAFFLCVALSCGAMAQEPDDLPDEVKQELRQVLPPGIKPPVVGFAPTMSIVVDRMLKLAEVDKDDFVLDLGSGDGRIPIAAALAHGAKGLGIEIVPVFVKRANATAAEAGVGHLVEFREADLFKTPISNATVVMLYLPVAVNNLLRPRFLKELRPGTRIVAHEFPMTEWPADVIERINHRTIYLWIVPAQVDGEWQLEANGKTFALRISQDHQVVTGTALVDDQVRPLRGMRLRGDVFDFEVELNDKDYATFHGRVSGDRIVPREVDGATQPQWRAVRNK